MQHLLDLYVDNSCINEHSLGQPYTTILSDGDSRTFDALTEECAN